MSADIVCRCLGRPTYPFYCFDGHHTYVSLDNLTDNVLHQALSRGGKDSLENSLRCRGST